MYYLLFPNTYLKSKISAYAREHNSCPFKLCASCFTMQTKTVATAAFFKVKLSDQLRGNTRKRMEYQKHVIASFQQNGHIKFL